MKMAAPGGAAIFFELFFNYLFSPEILLLKGIAADIEVWAKAILQNIFNYFSKRACAPENRLL
ncbi:hypothetical protein [Herbaspirillum robiniae]|uniref:hypothetical protein n=1 Tax=Herbaspirillum robiniae TaxID=2014887 RepID=UPI003D787D59